MKIIHALVLLFLARLALATEPAKAASPLDVHVVAPHPDDETIGCAGVTLQAMARGERVGIVVHTQVDGHARLTAVVAKKPGEQLAPDDFVRAGILRQRPPLRAAASLGVADMANPCRGRRLCASRQLITRDHFARPRSAYTAAAISRMRAA